VVDPDETGRFHADALLEALGDEPGLIVVSMVMFGSGQVVTGLDRMIAQAHARGARVLLDLYHAVGVLPLDMAALGADFAIGGSYKYLRGGTGACWLYLHPRHLDGSLVPLDTGWFAKRDPFSYERHDPPRFGPGGDAFLESTPPILPVYQARAGQELMLALGVSRLRAYSLAQQRMLVSELEALGVSAVGGREDHGAFVVVSHPEAPALAKRLKTMGVNTDARGTSLRLCPDLLNTGEELRKAARCLAQSWQG
jgi:kynureninase